MKKDFFGIKLSTIFTVLICLVIAFLLWLYFNIIEDRALLSMVSSREQQELYELFYSRLYC